MAKTLKVGFIGVGAIARHHMDYLVKMEGVELVCASDVSQASLDLVKDKYGIKRLYKDYKEMLATEKEIEAVDICTPNSLHAANTIAAHRSGKHVMVEKPMAMTATEAQAMIDAAKAAEKQLIIGFQFRFDSRTKVIRDQVERGGLGKILYVRAQWLRRRGIPNWGVFGRKDLQGGGPMIDLGVHVIEASHSMMGAPRPIAATGNTWTYFGNKASDVMCMWPNWDYQNYTVEDMAVGMIRFDTGAMLAVETSFVSHIEKDIWNIQVFGEKGGAMWETSQIFADHGGYMMNMTPGYVPKVDAFEVKMKHFVEVCRDGRANEAPGEHGLMIQKILDAIYMSSAQMKEVVIE